MATKVGEKYQCRECGLVVEVIEAGAGMLYCCDEIMRVEKPKLPLTLCRLSAATLKEELFSSSNSNFYTFVFPDAGQFQHLFRIRIYPGVSGSDTLQLVLSKDSPV